MDFTQKMKTLQTEDLFRITESSEADGYEPDLIDAAKREVEERGLNTSEFSVISEQVKAEKMREASRDKLPLSNKAWVGFVLIGPILFLSLFLMVSLFVQGYNRKGKESLYAILTGFLVWYALLAAVIFLPILFN